MDCSLNISDDDDVMIIDDDSDDESLNDCSDSSSKVDQKSNEDEATHCRNPWHKKWGNNDTILKNPSQVPRTAQFTFQLLGYKPLGRKSKKSGSHKFCVTCITRASNLTVEEFKELEVQAKSNWKHETYTETSCEQFNHPKCQNLSRKQSENAQIQAHLDKLEKLNIGEDEKAKQVKQLRMLAFVNPGKFMDDFDPERSEREMKKMNRRLHKEKNLKKNQIYDEDGLMIGTGKDLCDCLEVECVGCHFPCPKCKSEKCGGECRCSRKWMYEYIESEGTGITYSANT